MLSEILTLIAAATLLLGSPGPAPLALSATGATFGLRQGLPFLVGILTGLAVAISAVATGLSSLLQAYPGVALTLTILGALYVLYLAYKIATAPLIDADAASEQHPKFHDGLILSLSNPKAYAAFFALFSQFSLTAGSPSTSAAATGLVILLVVSFIDLLWLCAGGLLRPLFSSPKSARILRRSFAVLMVSAVAGVLITTLF